MCNSIVLYPCTFYSVYHMVVFVLVALSSTDWAPLLHFVISEVHSWWILCGQSIEMLSPAVENVDFVTQYVDGRHGELLYWCVSGMPSSPSCVRPSPAVSSDPAVSLEGAVGGAPAPVPSTSFSETASIMNELPPQMFGRCCLTWVVCSLNVHTYLLN